MNEEKLFLTSKQMAEEYDRLEAEGIVKPYFLEVNRGAQKLFFIGANHIDRPGHSQNDVIKQHWDRFLTQTNGQPCIAMIEAGMPKIPNSEEDAIFKFGETGLVLYLATKENIPAMCPEPDRIYEIKELDKEFSKEDIAYYYFARTVWQWKRKRAKEDFKEYLNRYQDRFAKSANWNNFDSSIEMMIMLHDQKHDHNFNLTDDDCFYYDCAPNHSQIADACSQIRNKHIFGKIQDNFAQGRSIFIVYGSGHLLIMKKALESLAL